MNDALGKYDIYLEESRNFKSIIYFERNEKENYN